LPELACSPTVGSGDRAVRVLALAGPAQETRTTPGQAAQPINEAERPMRVRMIVAGLILAVRAMSGITGSPLRQDTESFCEVAQLGAWPQAGELEQVAGDEPGAVVGVGEFGSKPFGLLEVMDRFADLTAHGVC
jgi:hypothetical protein